MGVGEWHCSFHIPGARVFMVQQVKIVGVAPETNRERILIGGSLDIHAFKDGREIWTQSGAMSYKIARQMYGNLDGLKWWHTQMHGLNRMKWVSRPITARV